MDSSYCEINLVGDEYFQNTEYLVLIHLKGTTPTKNQDSSRFREEIIEISAILIDVQAGEIVSTHQAKDFFKKCSNHCFVFLLIPYLGV